MDNMAFRFSNDELKKINNLLPKGYKFITREEFLKKQVPKVIPKKKVAPPPAFIVPNETLPLPPKPKHQKIEEYQPPQKKAVVPTLIPTQDLQPVGSSPKLLQRIKIHPSYLPLCQIKKYHISNISLKDIEQKVSNQGDNYKLGDL